ncbi:hypothetical protein MVEG_01334 [Podila verticillata NRRL 6337]|nr:hypothetical protein MVEG_01334 [Podila verticillata NRRL 6337]
MEHQVPSDPGNSDPNRQEVLGPINPAPVDVLSLMGEVQTKQTEFDTQLRLIMENMDSIRRAVTSLSDAQEANLSPSNSVDTSEISPQVSRSEAAFNRGNRRVQDAQTGSNQHQQQPRLSPTDNQRPKYEYQTTDPRQPLSKRGFKSREYHTKLWYIQDNLDFSGQLGIRSAEAILTQAKKIRCYTGKSLTGNTVDEWIDSYEKWYSANIGNPYTHGLDHETLRLFASACDPIPALSKAFNNYIEFSPNTPTWASAVHRLHMALTSQQEREAQTKESILEDCRQGSQGIVEYNNLFNHTLYTMQRHGYDMLSCRADRVVLLYTRNLRAQFRARLNAMVDTGLNYDSHESAHRNIYSIQCYMEYQGNLDERNHTEDLYEHIDPIRPPSPAPVTQSSSLHPPEPLAAPASVPVDAFGTVTDSEMMDLINSMDDLHLTDSQRLGVFRAMMKNKNRSRLAGPPRVNLTCASSHTAPAPVPHQSGSHRTLSVPYTRDYSNYRCRLCGLMGHIASSCPSKAQKLVCTNCEEKGHYSELCPREPGPRVMWMLRQEDYKNGAPRPLFEEEDDSFSETDYNLWDRERQIYQIEWEQYQDFHRGILAATRSQPNRENRIISANPYPTRLTPMSTAPTRPLNVPMEGISNTEPVRRGPTPTEVPQSPALLPPTPPPPRMIASHVEIPLFRRNNDEFKRLEAKTEQIRQATEIQAAQRIRQAAEAPPSQRLHTGTSTAPATPTSQVQFAPHSIMDASGINSMSPDNGQSPTSRRPAPAPLPAVNKSVPVPRHRKRATSNSLPMHLRPVATATRQENKNKEDLRHLTTQLQRLPAPIRLSLNAEPF